MEAGLSDRKQHADWVKLRAKGKRLLGATNAAIAAGDAARLLRLFSDATLDHDPLALKARGGAIRWLCANRRVEAFDLVGPIEDTRWDTHTLRSALLKLAIKQSPERAPAQLQALSQRAPMSPTDGAGAIELARQAGLDVTAVESRRDNIGGTVTPAAAAFRIVERGAIEPFAVNIGCHDGKSWGDPCYELYQAGWAGIAIDGGDYPDLATNLPSSDVRKLLNTMVTPGNACSLLADAGCPEDFALLKIDIDSFDGMILTALLSCYRPALIHIEVNPEIPPPVGFAIEYDRRYTASAFGGFFGCSVAFVEQAGKSAGYRLLSLDVSNPPRRQDALLVRADLVPCFDEADLRRSLEESFATTRPVKSSFWDIGIDSRTWRTISDPAELSRQVAAACRIASIARYGEVLPFRIELV